MSRRNGRVYGMSRTIINVQNLSKSRWLGLPLSEKQEKRGGFNTVMNRPFFIDPRTFDGKAKCTSLSSLSAYFVH